MSSRRSSLFALWTFGLAFGCIEAATVVYLRATPAPPPGPGLFPLTMLAPHLVGIEIVREACTLAILAAVAFVAAQHWRDRIGAFLLIFGVWDLAYYAALRVMSGWPGSLTDWDLLFLIPAPWMAPVWAPVLIASAFVAAGTYLFWTGERAHDYGVSDCVVLLASGVAVVLSFLLESDVLLAIEPQYFPLLLYWAGVVAGAGSFVHAELRRSRESHV